MEHISFSYNISLWVVILFTVGNCLSACLPVCILSRHIIIMPGTIGNALWTHTHARSRKWLNEKPSLRACLSWIFPQPSNPVFLLLLPWASHSPPPDSRGDVQCCRCGDWWGCVWCFYAWIKHAAHHNRKMNRIPFQSYPLSPSTSTPLLLKERDLKGGVQKREQRKRHCQTDWLAGHTHRPGRKVRGYKRILNRWTAYSSPGEGSHSFITTLPLPTA